MQSSINIFQTALPLAKGPAAPVVRLPIGQPFHLCSLASKPIYLMKATSSTSKMEPAAMVLVI
jgi:hypothetical protein